MVSAKEFDVKQKIAVLGPAGTGWFKELRLVKWGDYEHYLYDIRKWNDIKNIPGKGISLNKDELKALRDALNGLELD